MSVINKMLKDLDNRQQNSNNNVYAPSSKESSKTLIIVMCSVITILCIALVGGYWYFSKKADNTVAQNVAQDQENSAIEHQIAKQEEQEALINSDDIQAKEKTDDEFLSNEVKEQDVAALEDEIYGPDDVMKPIEVKNTSIVNTDENTVYVADEKPKVMKVQPVTLTKEQEIELDRKAAGMALSQGNIAQAKENFQSILAKDPRNTAAREKLASLSYGEGNLIQAQTILQQGIALQPTYANYRLLLARILMEQNRSKDALIVLTGISPKATAENLDYLATEASLATELNEPFIAIEAYSKLTRIMPREGKWWLGLAISFDRQGTNAAAKANYRQALSIGVPEASKKFAQERLAELEGK